MPKTTQTYSDEHKAEALEVFEREGLAEAFRRTGIHKTTISRWAKAAGVVTVAPAKMAEAREAAEERAKTLRAHIRLEMLEKVVDLLDRMDAPHVEFKGKDADEVEYPIAPASAVQSYATSIGILIDKYRLEVGEATGRTETRNLTEALDDHERQALRDAIDAWVARDPADAGTPRPTG